jgi:D-amino-acid dehydrogenase
MALQARRSRTADLEGFAGMMELTGTDDRIEPQRLSTMVQALNFYLPGWDRGQRRSAWAGLRPMTPDGLPVMGRAGIADNVYIATGHGMLGVTMAPLTGQIMADLICNGTTSYDISAFNPDRF